MNLVANSRLGIVKYNPQNIRRESGATRSLRTLWVPEEYTRVLLVPREMWFYREMARPWDPRLVKAGDIEYIAAHHAGVTTAFK